MTNYRVILKCEDGEFEIGSIGVQHSGAWAWGIDTVIPMRALETQGEGRDCKDGPDYDRPTEGRFAMIYYLAAPIARATTV